MHIKDFSLWNFKIWLLGFLIHGIKYYFIEPRWNCDSQGDLILDLPMQVCLFEKKTFTGYIATRIATRVWLNSKDIHVRMHVAIYTYFLSYQHALCMVAGSDVWKICPTSNLIDPLTTRVKKNRFSLHGHGDMVHAWNWNPCKMHTYEDHHLQ